MDNIFYFIFKYSSGVLTVGQVSHHSIELTWTRENDTNWTDEPKNWTCFILEQKNDRKHTYKEIHKGYNTRFTVENLEPKTTYTFRLKVTWPCGQQRYYPSVSASTEKEPLNGRNLHNAVLRSDELELCRVLQSIKVTVDVPDKLDFTPLMVAVMKGFTSGVQILVRHGADVNKKTNSGKDRLAFLQVLPALLWNSCAGGHLPVLHHLMQDGCEVDVRDDATWTPLMIVSVMTGDTAVASLLITAGADVNVQDRDGKTPLMVAVLNNYEHLVKILLDRGADPNIQNQVRTSYNQNQKAVRANGETFS
uniref:Fibronectin type III and ankyrin repeat domains 1 n=1 Tax=Sinocyclocheilus anshuiensis TaxID=1608454 RepID=A0A671M830_9TELE